MNHGRSALVLLLCGFAMACSSSSSSTTTPDGGGDGGTTIGPGTGPDRQTLGCDAVGQHETTTLPGTTWLAGSWGSIPSQLQKPPPGGALCGTDDDPSGGTSPVYTVVTGTLWGQEIYDFYNPLVTSLGCTLAPVTTETTSSGTMSYATYHCTNGAAGNISANGVYNFLTLTYGTQ
jgi:hypothetical protein